MELQVLSNTASRLLFYAYKKYKNGNSARRTVSQRHIRPSMTQNGSDNFKSHTTSGINFGGLQTELNKLKKLYKIWCPF